MPTIDLSPTPAPSADGALDAAPRRLGLTLAELRHAARLAGDAPLPFAGDEPGGDADAAGAHPDGGGLEGRLGRSPQSGDGDAHREAVARLRDPVESLTRRGLLTDAGLDPALAGAIGLLATPEVALDVDLALGSPETARLKAWHRQAGDAVAALATADGLVFELAWFGTDAWAAELARVAVVPEEVPTGSSRVPAHLDLPFELADAALEALAENRADLLDVLLARESADGPVVADGATVPSADAAVLLRSLHSEARGRLRALVARIGTERPDRADVVSWTLLGDGWHAVRPHRVGGVLRVEIRRVSATDLGTVLTPALAEAAR